MPRSRESAKRVRLYRAWLAFLFINHLKLSSKEADCISKQFAEIVRKIESLFRNNVVRRVEAVQRNVLVDYGELYQLRKEVKTLIENNDGLKSTLETMLDQLANLSLLLSAQRYSPLPMLLPEEHLLQSLPVAEVAATPIPTLVLMAK